MDGNLLDPDDRLAPTRVAKLREALKLLQKQGYKIRKEWLNGEAGGTCEFAGSRWFFLDLSLSIEEQLELVEAALQQHAADIPLP
jgi:hypothetical protein